MDKEKLINIIWITRASRINAEKRLNSKSVFIQFINVYYSFFSIAFSIISFVFHDERIGLISIFVSIALLISILFLNQFKYNEIARNYRTNYTELYKLELELHGNVSSDRISEIEKKYCDLLDSSCNHISYDYYLSVKNSKEDYKKNLWKSVRAKYYFEFMWRLIVKIMLIALPLFLFAFRGVI